MKIAISVKDDSANPPFNPRFGRAPFFYLVDPETESGEAHPNPAVNADSGAGIQAAQIIAKHGATAVVSNSFGPKAYRTLTAAGIKMYLVSDGEGLSMTAILKNYLDGELTEASGPTHRGGH